MFPQSAGVALFSHSAAAADGNTRGRSDHWEETREGGADVLICLNKKGIFIPS